MKQYEANGYPARAINRAIYEIDHPRTMKPKKPSTYLSLPFIGEAQVGEMRRLLKKCGLI